MHRRPVILGLLLTATLTTTRLAMAEDEATSFHFGVMGEVSRPGTYELNTPTVDVASLVRLTGGLTSQANGRLQVIRNGAVAHRMLLSSRLQFTLLDGDLLLVGGDPFRAEDIIQVGASASAGGNSSNTDAPRQLAIMGLIDRPVVLKVLADAANVATIVASLGQDPEIATSVRVIAPDGDRNFETTAALPDGTVLVFDPAVVNADRIPQLPDLVKFALAEVVAGEVTKGPVRSAAVDDNQADSDAEPDAPGIARVSSPFSVTELPPPPEALDLPAHLLDGPIADAATNDSAAPPVDVASQTSPQPETDVAAGGSVGSLLQTLPEKLGANLVYIVGALAIISACSLLWSMARTATAEPVAPQSRQQPSLLDALIHNTLPLEEEPVRLAAGMTFFGKPLGPQSLRVDVAQELQGPHSRASVVSATQEAERQPSAMQTVVEQPQESNTTPDGVQTEKPKPHFRADPGHPAAPRPAAVRTGGVLDRALSSVQGADRS